MAARLRLLAASVGLVALAACSGDGGVDSRPEPRPTTAPRAVPEFLDSSCPPRSTPPAYPADGVIPDGAVAVRLCNGPDTMVPLDVPRELLTTGVEELRAAVEAMEPIPDDRLCHSAGGPTLAFWFLYADGDARAVTWDGGGCGDTTVAPGTTLQGEDLLDPFRRLLLQQRQGRVPPGADEAPGCNPIDAPVSVFPLGRDLELAAATYCGMPDGVRWRDGQLSLDQVTALTADLAEPEPRYPSKPCRSEVGGYSQLVGLTVWGERVRLAGSCHVYALTDEDRWRLSPVSVRMLRSLRLSAPYRQCSTLDRRTCPGP